MGAVRTLDLYVVRHGLTKANIEKRYIGHLDEPVMEERMEEMFELKKAYPRSLLMPASQVTGGAACRPSTI